MRTKRALIFDLDDTIYDCNYTNNTKSVQAVCRYAARELLQMPVERVQDAFDRAREEVKSDMLGDEAAQHNRMLYFQRTLEKLDIPPIQYALEMYDYFWQDFLQRIQPYPGALDFLKRWHAKGGKIAICTDMTVHIQHRKLRALGIADLIDVLVTSEEVGVEKPAKEIYERVLAKLQMAPEEVLYLGDSLTKDVLGPGEIGIEALWYVDEAARQKSVEEMKIAGDQGIEVVRNYEQVAKRLMDAV